MGLSSCAEKTMGRFQGWLSIHPIKNRNKKKLRQKYIRNQELIQKMVIITPYDLKSLIFPLSLPIIKILNGKVGGLLIVICCFSGLVSTQTNYPIGPIRNSKI